MTPSYTFGWLLHVQDHLRASVITQLHARPCTSTLVRVLQPLAPALDTIEEGSEGQDELDQALGLDWSSQASDALESSSSLLTTQDVALNAPIRQAIVTW